MAEPALCREDTPPYGHAVSGAEIRRVLQTVRRVFPGAVLREVRKVIAPRPPVRPLRLSRRPKLGDPTPMV